MSLLVLNEVLASQENSKSVLKLPKRSERSRAALSCIRESVLRSLRLNKKPIAVESKDRDAKLQRQVGGVLETSEKRWVE